MTMKLPIAMLLVAIAAGIASHHLQDRATAAAAELLVPVRSEVCQGVGQ